MSDKNFLDELESALSKGVINESTEKIVAKGKKKLLEGMRVPNSYKSILKYMKQLGEENDMEISRRGEINGSDFV